MWQRGATIWGAMMGVQGENDNAADTPTWPSGMGRRPPTTPPRAAADHAYLEAFPRIGGELGLRPEHTRPPLNPGSVLRLEVTRRLPTTDGRRSSSAGLRGRGSAGRISSGQFGTTLPNALRGFCHGTDIGSTPKSPAR